MREAFVGLLAFGTACLLCVIPLNVVLVGAYLVWAGGRGIALTDWGVGPAPGLSFYAAIAVWAAATWHSARLVLERPMTRLHAVWMPRLLGALIYPPLAMHFAAAGHTGYALVVAAIAIAWLACLADLEPGTAMLLAFLAALTLLHLLVVAFLLSRAALPRFVGVAPVVLLAFASWTLLGSLAYLHLPKSYRLL
jgi:hypothetical protein